MRRLYNHFLQADKANETKINCEEKLDELLGGVEKIFRYVDLLIYPYELPSAHFHSRLIRCDDAPVLNMMQKRVCSINNVKLFLGIVEKRTSQLISSINATEQPCKVLAKKDRIPKFNVRESAKVKTPKSTN